VNGDTVIDKDYDVLWRPKHVYVPAWQFTGLSYEATGAAGIKSVGAGTPSATNLKITEIGTSGVTGIVFEAAGDSVFHNMILPYDYDKAYPLNLRIHWASGSTDVADTVTWLVEYVPIRFNITAIVAASTALDTVIAPDDVPVATANAWCVTEYGRINGGKFDDNVEAISFEMEMDAFDAGLTEAKHIIGLELAYTPKKLVGPSGMRREAKRPTYIGGKHYPN
jgi:hypothetical protein